MAKASTELVWMKMLLEELGFPITNLMILWCDNQAAMHIANNPIFHERTKHIELDCHYILEKEKGKLIQLKNVSTRNQLADIFTKALPKAQHEETLFKLCLTNTHP